MTDRKTAFIRENAPCYLYDEAQIIARCRALKAAVPQAEFLYSVKTNPFPPVIQTAARQGFGADAASACEVLLAEQAGIPRERIYYSAPGKTEKDLETVRGRCHIIADSFAELDRLERLAAAGDETLRVGIRVNPDFSMDGQSAAASKFGIDADQIFSADLRYPHLTINGIHVHLRSQVLDTDLLCDYYCRCCALAEKTARLPGTEIEYINLGSGIGTVYDDAAEKPLSLEKIGRTLAMLQAQCKIAGGAKFILETGRYIVCNAGTYYTPIVDRKVSGGRTYLIVRNAINGFLRPAVAELLRQNLGSYPANGQEPLYTRGTQCAFDIPGRDSEPETVDVVGNLCTALDVLARDIRLPRAEIGDILSVSNAGSYGCTLSPVLFSSQDTPKEFLWRE